MTPMEKLRIMLPVTTFMGISFLLADHLHARIAIVVVWTAHVLFFLFRIPSR